MAIDLTGLKLPTNTSQGMSTKDTPDVYTFPSQKSDVYTFPTQKSNTYDLLSGQVKNLESGVNLQQTKLPTFNIQPEQEKSMFDRLADGIIPTASAVEYDEEKIKRFIQSGVDRGLNKEQIQKGYELGLSQGLFDLKTTTETPETPEVTQDVTTQKIGEDTITEPVKKESALSKLGTAFKEELTSIPGKISESAKTTGKALTNVGDFFKFESNVDDGVVESGLKFLGNLPGDTVELAGDLITVASDPSGTAKSIKELAGTTVEQGLNKTFSTDIGQNILRSAGVSEEKLNEIKTDGYFTTEERAVLKDAVAEELDKLANEPGAIKELLVENPADVLTSVTGGLGTAKNIAKTKNMTSLVSKLETLEKVTNPIKIQSEALKIGTTGAEKTKNYLFGNKNLDELVLEASQGKKKDISAFKQAISKIDTKDVNTYEDLDNAFSEKITEIAKKQDELLPSEKIYNLDDLTKTSKGGTVSINYFEKAIDDMLNLAEKTDNIDDIERLQNLKNKGSYSIKDINDVAREYNTTFSNKAFNKDGTQKFTNVGQSYENIRSGVKNTARDLLPDDTMKTLDGELTDLYTSKKLSEKMISNVDDLVKKLESRGAIGKIVNGIGKAFDIVTLGVPKEFFTSAFLKSGVGKSVLDSLSLQERLNSNLKKIEKLIKQADNLNDAQLEKNTIDVLKDMVGEKGLEIEATKNLSNIQ